MWNWLRDRWRVLELKAKYERRVHEELLALSERQENGVSVRSDEPGWTLAMSGGRGGGLLDQGELRNDSRRLVEENPYARNALRLLEVYVTGTGFRCGCTGPVDQTELADQANAIWEEFLEANRGHYSFREHARRTWRDGECFVRLFAGEGTPSVRFIDPERIGGDGRLAETEGIVTDEEDVETVKWYLRLDGETGQLAEWIAAEEMIHTKLEADSNEKRGRSVFGSVLEGLRTFSKWLDTELQARRLQASIVLWRRVQGNPTQVTGLGDPVGDRTERIRGGTILTTSMGTDLQFLQPNTNFGDAIGLGRLVLLNISAGLGLPEFMLTSDASNGNFASTMVAEGPAVKRFASEQAFFAGEFEKLWRWVMRDAERRGVLPKDSPGKLKVQWSFPQLVSRDRSKERLSEVRLLEAGVLSKAEVARRDGVDYDVMHGERIRHGEVTNARHA